MRTGQEDGTGAMDAFGSPTVLHFCFVLLVAAVVSTPRHTLTSLSICLFVPSLLGLVYTIIVVARMRRQKAYVPVMEDWIWHCILPIAAYTSMTLSTVVFWYRPELMLYVVGASALLLLYVGIHNAWDAATWMAMNARKTRAGSLGGHEPPPSGV
jgi:predicted Na+-dependent transporter